MTKKELIEGGWIDKYVLGLTSEQESSEVERLASLIRKYRSRSTRPATKYAGNLTAI